MAKLAIKKRCSTCHIKDLRLPHSLSDENGLSFWKPSFTEPQLKRARHIVFNLSIPEKSLMLLGPLAKEMGGYGACRETLGDGTFGKPVAIFSDTNDPDYQSILGLIKAGKARLEQVKRFDMPGFNPTPAYVREMKTYGVLPADFDLEKETVDVYALDRKYWDLFVYQPQVVANPH